MSKKDKRIRCKVCGKRIRIQYSYKGEEMMIFCPNCNSHGVLKRRKKKKFGDRLMSEKRKIFQN